MSQQLPRRVTLAPHVVWHQVEDEVVVLNILQETYHGLNEVGSTMLKALIEKGEPEDVVTQIVTEYEIDEASVRHDLANLLEQLVAAQLVKIED